MFDQSTLFSILLATGSISAIAFLSAALLSLFPQWLKRIVPGLVALAAGTMLSTAFLHLIPESLELFPTQLALILVLASFVGFLILERLFRWHHCHGNHQHEESHRSVGYMNLIGDGFHNFVDGLVIAAAFTADPGLGIATTVAVAAHELPQEIGDFGILIHSGFPRGAALLANFGVALTVVSGGLTGILLLEYVDTLSMFLLPLAAGSFLYIATVDLVPEIHREHRGWESIVILIMFGLGLALLPLSTLGLESLGIVEAHSHGAIESPHDEDHEHETFAKPHHEELTHDDEDEHHLDGENSEND